MNVLFWNVGKEALTADQEAHVKAVISEHGPAIICLAEGTRSIAACEKLEKLVTGLSYECYYSPRKSRDPSLNLNYSFVSNGLKIFFNASCVLREKFSFAHQRVEGRAVLLKTSFNSQLLSFLFLHNYSKRGGRESSYAQSDFLSSIASMLKRSGIIASDEQPVLLGDFNLEPWDVLMRHESYLGTTFLSKHAAYESRKSSSGISYYNPAIEAVIKSRIHNLGGTFYTKANGWALLDYVLYDKDKVDLRYRILTKTYQGNLLDNSHRIYKAFIQDGFDHLPILVTIL